MTLQDAASSIVITLFCIGLYVFLVGLATG